MRRVGLALALAVLAAAAPWAAGFAGAAGEPEAYTPGAVLTPTELGITDPAQGFYPFIPSGGNNANNQFGLFALGGFNGCGAFSIGFCPFFSSPPYWSTFSQVGTLGLGGGVNSQLGTGLGGGAFGNGLFGNPFLANRFGTSLTGLGGLGQFPGFSGTIIIR
jgi:hypothetical protein